MYRLIAGEAEQVILVKRESTSPQIKFILYVVANQMAAQENLI